MASAEHDDLVRASAARQLEPFGIGEDQFHVEYVEDCQHYQLHVGAGALTQEQVAGAMRVADQFGELTFGHAGNTRLMREIQQRQARASLRERAAELRGRLVGLPGFDPAKDDLAEFARELERFCGLDAGSMLVVNGAVVCLSPRNEYTPTLDGFQRLLEAVIAALGDQDEVQLGVLAREGSNS